MRAFTHLFGGLLAGLIVFKLYPFFYIIPIALFASITPDFDYAFTILGRRFQSIFLPHRGPTHSLVFISLISIGVYSLINFQAGFAFFLGGLSHLILDSLNPSGVPLLWPLSTRFGSTIKYNIINDVLISALLLVFSAVIWIA